MALKKCPICSGRVVNGVCSECGYSIPDESEISSVYNYSPDDDDFSGINPADTAEKDLMPEIKTYGAAPVAYAERKEENAIPDVRVNTYTPPVQPKINAAPNANSQNANPYANFSPVENQARNPMGKKSVFNMSGGNSSSDISINWVHLIAYAFLAWSVPFMGVWATIKCLINYLKTKNKGDLIMLAVVGAVTLFGFVVNFGSGIMMFAIEN